MPIGPLIQPVACPKVSAFPPVSMKHSQPGEAISQHIMEDILDSIDYLTHPSIHPSICLSICLSISIYLCLYIYIIYLYYIYILSISIYIYYLYIHICIKKGCAAHIHPAKRHPLLASKSPRPFWVTTFRVAAAAVVQRWVPSGNLTWLLTMASYSGFSHETW